MAYSADFRNKVVQLYNSGTSTADLCAQFHISRSILYQWSEEAKEIGRASCRERV